MPTAPALKGHLICAPADIRLIGNDQGSGEDLHSILLMTLSPYFQIVLNDGDFYKTTNNNNGTGIGTSNNNNNNNDVKTLYLEGADSETIKIIKDYAYTGKTKLTVDNVKKVILVADMYNIVGLINECETFLIKNTNTPAC